MAAGGEGKPAPPFLSRVGISNGSLFESAFSLPKVPRGPALPSTVRTTHVHVSKHSKVDDGSSDDQSLSVNFDDDTEPWLKEAVDDDAPPGTGSKDANQHSHHSRHFHSHSHGSSMRGDRLHRSTNKVNFQEPAVSDKARASGVSMRMGPGLAAAHRALEEVVNDRIPAPTESRSGATPAPRQALPERSVVGGPGGGAPFGRPEAPPAANASGLNPNSQDSAPAPPALSARTFDAPPVRSSGSASDSRQGPPALGRPPTNPPLRPQGPNAPGSGPVVPPLPLRPRAPSNASAEDPSARAPPPRARGGAGLRGVAEDTTPRNASGGAGAGADEQSWREEYSSQGGSPPADPGLLSVRSTTASTTARSGWDSARDVPLSARDTPRNSARAAPPPIRDFSRESSARDVNPLRDYSRDGAGRSADVARGSRNNADVASSSNAKGGYQQQDEYVRGSSDRRAPTDSARWGADRDSSARVGGSGKWDPVDQRARESERASEARARDRPSGGSASAGAGGKTWLSPEEILAGRTAPAPTPQPQQQQQQQQQPRHERKGSSTDGDPADEQSIRDEIARRLRGKLFQKAEAPAPRGGTSSSTAPAARPRDRDPIDARRVSPAAISDDLDMGDELGDPDEWYTPLPPATPRTPAVTERDPSPVYLRPPPASARRPSTSDDSVGSSRENSGGSRSGRLYADTKASASKRRPGSPKRARGQKGRGGAEGKRAQQGTRMDVIEEHPFEARDARKKDERRKVDVGSRVDTDVVDLTARAPWEEDDDEAPVDDFDGDNVRPTQKQQQQQQRDSEPWRRTPSPERPKTGVDAWDNRLTPDEVIVSRWDRARGGAVRDESGEPAPASSRDKKKQQPSRDQSSRDQPSRDQPPKQQQSSSAPVKDTSDSRGGRGDAGPSQDGWAGNAGGGLRRQLSAERERAARAAGGGDVGDKARAQQEERRGGEANRRGEEREEDQEESPPAGAEPPVTVVNTPRVPPTPDLGGALWRPSGNQPRPGGLASAIEENGGAWGGGRGRQNNAYNARRKNLDNRYFADRDGEKAREREGFVAHSKPGKDKRPDTDADDRTAPASRIPRPEEARAAAARNPRYPDRDGRRAGASASADGDDEEEVGGGKNDRPQEEEAAAREAPARGRERAPVGPAAGDRRGPVPARATRGGGARGGTRDQDEDGSAPPAPGSADVSGDPDAGEGWERGPARWDGRVRRESAQTEAMRRAREQERERERMMRERGESEFDGGGGADVGTEDDDLGAWDEEIDAAELQLKAAADAALQSGARHRAEHGAAERSEDYETLRESYNLLEKLYHEALRVMAELQASTSSEALRHVKDTLRKLRKMFASAKKRNHALNTQIVELQAKINDSSYHDEKKRADYEHDERLALEKSYHRLSDENAVLRRDVGSLRNLLNGGAVMEEVALHDELNSLKEAYADERAARRDAEEQLAEERAKGDQLREAQERLAEFEREREKLGERASQFDTLRADWTQLVRSDQKSKEQIRTLTAANVELEGRNKYLERQLAEAKGRPIPAARNVPVPDPAAIRAKLDQESAQRRADARSGNADALSARSGNADALSDSSARASNSLRPGGHDVSGRQSPAVSGRQSPAEPLRPPSGRQSPSGASSGAEPLRPMGRQSPVGASSERATSITTTETQGGAVLTSHSQEVIISVSGLNDSVDQDWD